MVTLRQLRYFAALARHGHFGRAAEECHVSQPALSVQIQEFEATLQASLIERKRHSIALTPVGAEVLRRANAILADVTDLEDFARHRAGILSGSLSLGVIPSIAPYLLPHALPLLHGRFPDLRLTIRERQTKELVADLKDGNLDVVLIALPLEESWAQTIKVFAEALFLIAPAGSGAQQPETDTLLLLEEGHCIHDQALHYCRRNRIPAQQQYGAASLSTIVQMVANGYGKTLLPQIALPVEVRDNMQVAISRLPDPEPVRTVGLAWRRTSPRKTDFVELGRVLTQCAPCDAIAAQ
ncbi:hydrogen peroxide-inducible genes activator [Methylovirgula sp. 4M-Z18]|uniref:hydrogen peroxide-inducible genes activator n=1 Tax=Methylovirgula sp. 4M-Z18 TaxID=2293567 RepID=UPI000E2F6488|nr:hydrogen peroxide-inducible genes activator [Methylovirgula sp. 4M-Z18]RFB79827.1 hydrogen peroxide-inducible genes activator [Methylovirgula sp. 4M-Z18]